MKSLLIAAAIGACVIATAPARAVPNEAPAPGDLTIETASDAARAVADWIIRAGDHKGLPFAIVDKVAARLYAFDSRARFVRATPVLVGIGIGDVFPPGVA